MGLRPQVVLHKPSRGFGLTTEEGRAFYQDRLRLWSFLGLLISGTFFVVGALLYPLYGELMTAWQPPVVHFATLVVMGVSWLLCGRGRRSATLLNLLDGGVVCAVLLAFAVQLLWVHPVMLVKLRMTLLLIATTILVGRAIFVPSTAHRTFWLGVVAVAPVIGFSALTHRVGGGSQSPLDVLDIIWALLWCASAIGVSSVASAVIYGLRQEVREAQRLGQYTLREKLGAGGMGVVYKASHAMLRRPTAIKLLPPDKAGEASIARFEREVQLTAGLTHPNTVAIYDYGRTPDGIFYYAMEYLDGIDLAVLVSADGPQAAGRVRHVLLQVVGALGEAHGVGLIHRDIKPANIILCRRGGIADVAKVVDFGLVKELEGGPGVGLTNVDAIAGTPLYLSPEAITSPQEVDARADVYALGAVSYFLLTGTPVFEGRTPVEVCSHHLHTPPEPPSQRLGQTVPAELEEVVLACLEKDPSRRPQTAEEMGERLKSCKGLGRWDEEASAAWWAERGRGILQSRSDTPVDESAPTLSVDLRRRHGEVPPGEGFAWPWS